jgi:hypothetical protein
MLFALPSYQFPYIVMNRCLYQNKWSKMTLTYWMIVERYPNLNGGVGAVILGCEIFSLLDGNINSPPTAREE